MASHSYEDCLGPSLLLGQVGALTATVSLDWGEDCEMMCVVLSQGWEMGVTTMVARVRSPGVCSRWLLSRFKI